MIEKTTMKNILFLLISLLVISCKTNSKPVGEYQINLSDSTYYTFNLANKKYTKKLSSGSIAKGKFKILDLSSEKKLFVCNEMILRRANGLIKETNSSGDSITIGTYSGFKNLGATVFEITSKNDILFYRKTHVNYLQDTESEGILIKK